MNKKQYNKFKGGAKLRIGYTASMTPREMVLQGKSKGRTLKEITKELIWASNIIKKIDPVKSKKFYKGALFSMKLEKNLKYK